MMYNILFIGIGSIGKRHIKNVSLFLTSRGDGCLIDVVRSGYGAVLDQEILSFIHQIYSFEDNLTKKYEAVFITGPTGTHYSTLKRYSNIGKCFFIEKPVFDKSDYSLTDIPQKLKYYVACPLRYNRVLQYVKKEIDCSKALCVRSISSSYLPEWRPNTDYRTTYSAHKNLGGGVSIDLIHEWDYLSWLFGMPEKVISLIDRVSNLEIDSDDLALYIGKNSKVVFELHLDYFGRENTRQLQVFLPTDTVLADIAGGTVTYLREQKKLDFQEDRNAYQMREIEHFFDIMDGKCQSDNTISNAVQVLKIAKGEI